MEVYGDQEETEVEMDVEGEGWVTADNAATESGHPDREFEHVADLSGTRMVGENYLYTFRGDVVRRMCGCAL